MADSSPSSYDAVEEFVLVGDGDEIYGLMRKGNRAFHDNRFEDAISFYSKAHLSKPGDPVILSNRSVTFYRISQLLRARSASDSEYQPLNGLDPTTLAELALKDAEKVLKARSNSPKSYFLKAKSLILLERYEDARETILSGLLVDPHSQILQANLQSLDNMISDSVNNERRWKPQRIDDFDCTLCLKLLYEPVTTPCGHSFCRSCLLQAMDHGNRCPMCRTVLLISPRTYPTSVTLNNIIQKSFPEEYVERKLEHESVTYLGINLMPLFVMDVVLPCQKLSLNIFEPRYRLMVRRIMEGNHGMGMVIIDSTTGSIADVACEVEIIECEPLPDGRFYIEIEGRRRFRILESWDQDGYRVAKVEWIEDMQHPEGSPEREDLRLVANTAAEIAQNWMSAIEGRRSRHVELQAEGMPGPEDPEKFSFWLVNMLNMRPSQRLELLRLRDTRERISCSLSFIGAANKVAESNDWVCPGGGGRLAKQRRII